MQCTTGYAASQHNLCDTTTISNSCRHDAILWFKCSDYDIVNRAQ